MQKFNKSSSIAQLTRARERFDRWRSGRKRRRERMPEKLWQQAAKLAKTYGVHRTAKALGLHHNRLKERVVGRQPSRAVEFVEVAPDVAPLIGGTVVEIERPGGAKLRIGLRGGEALDVTALARGFLEAGQ